jgi:hypothetical protein
MAGARERQAEKTPDATSDAADKQFPQVAQAKAKVPRACGHCTPSWKKHVENVLADRQSGH